MEIPLLKDLLIIFGLAIGVLFLCNRLRVPTTVGFLLTGVLAGPHGFGLISAVKDVEILAEIGVVLLLFTIGIEFSLKGLLAIRKSVFLGGSLQVLLTLLAAFVIARQLNLETGRAVFIGFLVSLSSTAIVLKILQERAEIESPHGRSALGVLIFQDVAVVPMMLLVPVLAGTSAGLEGASPIVLIVKGIGIVLLVAASAKWIVPNMLYRIARTRSRELFLLAVLVICFAVAWLTYSLGLSLALGAFLAGLIISESEYSHQTLGNILPFGDVFTSLFFVSIGMLLDVGFLARHPIQVVPLAVAVMVLKSLLACCAVSLLGFPIRTGILTGLALCQIGEFSFILSMTGIEHGLLAGEIYQFFLAVSVITMGATPFVMAVAPAAADAIVRLPLPGKLKSGFSARPDSGGVGTHKLRDHLLIVGFGLNGRNVAQAAKVAGISHLILEMNPDTVRRERAQGEPILYGDSTQEAVLMHARINEARVMVVAISDPAATRRITAMARRFNPKLYIIVRTRFFQEMAHLYALGADEVIPEEFETSVEIFTRVLSKYLIPRDEIEKFVADARASGYQMFRSLSQEAGSLCDLERHLPDIEISTIRVSEDSPFAGKSLADIEMRKKYGLTLLAIRRNSQVLANPGGSTVLMAGDILIIMGSPSQLAAIAGRLHAPEVGGAESIGNRSYTS